MGDPFANSSFFSPPGAAAGGKGFAHSFNGAFAAETKEERSTLLDAKPPKPFNLLTSPVSGALH